MIKINTVLILGAGASTHAGYPLGMTLLNDLCRIRTDKRYPNIPEDWSIDDVDNLLLSLSRSGHYSIDAFLEHSKYRELGKYLIAYQLKQAEDVDRLFPPHDSGWYQMLFNALINECGEKLNENNLSIITFNYDRSLEVYLHNALKFRFNLSEDNAWKQVAELSIIHVHGILGEYPEIPYKKEASVEELYKISKNIKIIHEIKDHDGTFCSDEFAEAYEKLLKAKRIIFLGFGFHADNVRRFRFFSDKNLEGLEMFTTSFGLTSYEYRQKIANLAQYGLSEKQIPWNAQGCHELFRKNVTLM